MSQSVVVAGAGEPVALLRAPLVYVETDPSGLHFPAVVGIAVAGDVAAVVVNQMLVAVHHHQGQETKRVLAVVHSWLQAIHTSFSRYKKYEMTFNLCEFKLRCPCER